MLAARTLILSLATLEGTMVEALQYKNELMQMLLERWLDEVEWIYSNDGHWDNPDLFVCDWCGGQGNTAATIEHTQGCLIGQTIRVLGGNRLGAIND